MQPLPEEFRRAMRHWATGVTVVSAAEQGELHGMTVNSFTSLSLHPPLVLVSLEQGTRTHEMIHRVGTFGITILSRLQQEISDRFAGRLPDTEDRFAGLETFTIVSGAPFLVGGLSFIDCRVIHSHLAGTHTVFFGDVLAVRIASGDPLLYYNQDYRSIRDA
jgi:flavin reductase (DIM6/NTAB) family NADH-FMN oxidoreductase RutF